MTTPDDPNDRLIFLSLKPTYANAILAGTKTIELRRVRPRIDVPTDAIIYASSPQMAVVGECVVNNITEHTLNELWKAHGAQTGITRSTFDDYYEGTETGIALHLTDIRTLPTSIPLADIRGRVCGFEPPQSFRYLTRSSSRSLLA